MTLRIGGRHIGDGRVQSLSLRPVVGAFELIFHLHLSVQPGEGELPRASILGAGVVAKPSRGDPRRLGFARREQPIEVECRPHMSTSTPNIHISLQPGQVAALEELRAAGDLTLDLSLWGNAVDHQGESHFHGECSIRVPRSEWLQKLRDARARNVMLLEVPLPLDGVTDHWEEVASNLQRAEEYYRNGDYRGCISSCRIAIDELGKLRDMNWTSALDRLATDRRKDMNKSQREEAMFAVLRHYTHMAHHATGDGGANDYTRAEARFVLCVTAAATAHTCT